MPETLRKTKRSLRLFLEQEQRRDGSTDEGTIPRRVMLREGRNSFRDRKAAALCSDFGKA